MNKLNKTAKRIDGFFKAVFWLSIAVISVFIILFAVNMVMSLHIGEENSEMTAATISLDFLNLDLAPDYIQSADITEVIFNVELLFVLIALAFICYAIRIIRKILKPMCEGLPFNNAVSVNLKKLAWTSLIGGGVLSVADMVIETVMYKMYDFENLFLNDKIVGCSVDYTLDLSFVMAFAIYYLLAYIFKYGEELQTQSDETL